MQQVLQNLIFGIPLFTLVLILSLRLQGANRLLCFLFILSFVPTYAVAYIPQLGLNVAGMQLSYFISILFPFIGLPFIINRKVAVLIFAVAVCTAATIAARRLDFTPIEAYEFAAESRTAYSFMTTVDSLRFSVITRSAYLFASLGVFLAVSSLRISQEQILKCIDSAILFLTIVGVFQVFIYYTPYYDSVYMACFYNVIDLEMTMNRLPYQEAYGIKRMNATLFEPSIFASAVTLLGISRYLINPTFNWSILLSVFIAMASTASTFLLSIVAWLFIATLQLRRMSLAAMATYLSTMLLIPAVILGTTLLSDVWGETARQKSLDERWKRGFVVPLENWWNHPFLGYGYGTDRAVVMAVDLLESFGIFGCVTAATTFFLTTKPRTRIAFGCVLILGCSCPDLAFPYIWYLLGFIEADTPEDDDERDGAGIPNLQYA